jgi:protease-4
MVDWIYDQFIAHVAEGRHLERARVEEIAQGRVWSGMEAQKLGLVDEIGGLEKAVAFAAKQANLGKNYRVIEFPRTKTLNELIAEALETIKPIASRVSEKSVVDLAVERMKVEFRRVAQFNDPQGLYVRLPVEFELK